MSIEEKARSESNGSGAPEESWDFAGWGKSRRIKDIGRSPVKVRELGVGQAHAKKLGQWRATAICGNDITSSCLYVSALSILSDIPPKLAEHLSTVDHLYPRLRIDFLTVKGKFGPELIERLSRRLNVPKNYMFIGTPGDRFPHRIASLGGVRLVMG
ncbi:MAG: hypothetical protein ABII00_07770 [Elusimicrobiota bacterium]